MDEKRVATLLYNISEGLNDPSLVLVNIKDNLKQIEKEFLILEKLNLVKIERREGKIYNSELTKEGKRYLYKHYNLLKNL